MQNAVQFLDNLVKDIVTASPSFNIDAFIPKLRDYLRVVNPHKRQFLVSWISVLDSVPDLDVLAHLPELLDGLMNMLSDPNREIRVAAHKAMMVRLCTDPLNEAISSHRHYHVALIHFVILTPSPLPACCRKYWGNKNKYLIVL